MVLDQDHTMIRDAVRTFVRDAILPHAAAWDRDRTFPKDVHRQLAELGAYGVMVPPEHGGAGLDALALALILEEIAAGGTRAVDGVFIKQDPLKKVSPDFDQFEAKDSTKPDTTAPVHRAVAQRILASLPSLSMASRNVDALGGAATIMGHSVRRRPHVYFDE